MTRCSDGEPLDDTGAHRRRRTDPRRRPRRGAVPRFAQRSAGVRAARRRPRRPAAAARPHRRAHRRLPGDRAGGRRGLAGVRRDDVGHRGGQPRARRGRGQLRPGAADRAAAPTGPTNCSAPAPTRPWSSSATSAPRSAPPSASAWPRAPPERMDALNAQWRSATCRVLVAATGSRTANAGPVQFDIPLREPLVPDAGRRRDYAPAGRPGRQAVDLHAAGDASTSRWTSTSRPDTVVIAGHGAGVHPNLAALPTVAEPTAPPAANPLHPLALPPLRPQQVIMLGRPDPAPAGVDAAGRPVGAGVRADHRSALARRVGQLAGHRHPRGDHRHARPGWLRRCAEANAPRRRRGARPARGAPADDGPARGRRRRRRAARRATSWCSARPTRCATRHWSA